MKKFDQLDYIMRFESGELRGGEILELFANLIKTGLAWKLQGSYGRFAVNLIDRGYLSTKGEILKDIESED